MSDYALKYLFIATFTDGSFIAQSDPDVSLTEPNKSRFTDVMKREDELYSFRLKNNETEVAVNLIGGMFMFNGTLCQVQDPSIEFPPDTKFRVIYFRRVRRTRGYDTITGQPVAPLCAPVEYHIGWQTTIDGKNYQQTIALT